MEAHAYPAPVVLDTRRVRERFTKTGLRRLSGGGSRVSPQRALSLVPLCCFFSENAAAIESRARAVCSPRALVAHFLPVTRERFAIVLDFRRNSSLARRKPYPAIQDPDLFLHLSPSIFSLGFTSSFRVSLSCSSSSFLFFRPCHYSSPSVIPYLFPFVRTRFDRVRECVTDRIAFRARGFWTPLPENSAVRRTGVRRSTLLLCIVPVKAELLDRNL